MRADLLAAITSADAEKMHDVIHRVSDIKLSASLRSLVAAGEARVLTISQTYDTGIEDRFESLANEVGMVLERQRDLLGMGEWLGRVDFVYRPRLAVLEVDSAL